MNPGDLLKFKQEYDRADEAPWVLYLTPQRTLHIDKDGPKFDQPISGYLRCIDYAIFLEQEFVSLTKRTMFKVVSSSGQIGWIDGEYLCKVKNHTAHQQRGTFNKTP